MGLIRHVTFALGQFLSAAQAAIVVVAGLGAASFFFFSTDLTSSVVLEDRVDRSLVAELYGGQPVPVVVLQTLALLDTLSIPRPSTAQPTDALSDPYPLSLVCSIAPEMVEGLFRGGCRPDSRIAIPFYDRVLFFSNEQASAPLSVPQLREAASFLTQSLFVRATVTVSNTGGRGRATNVTVQAPSTYRLRAQLPPHAGLSSRLDLEPNRSVILVYETSPVGLSTPLSQQAASSFPVSADPPGPTVLGLRTSVVQLAVILLAMMLVLAIAVFSAIVGPEGRPKRGG